MADQDQSLIDHVMFALYHWATLHHLRDKPAINCQMHLLPNMIHPVLVYVLWPFVLNNVIAVFHTGQYTKVNFVL